MSLTRQRLVVGLFASSLVSQASFGAIVADFFADFQTPTPAPGWSYQWNPASVNLNDPSGYQNLIYNSTDAIYDSNGAAGLPDPAPAAYVLVAQGVVHPGLGAAQSGDGLEHAAITTFTLSSGGSVSVDNLLASDASAGGGSGAGVIVAKIVGGVYSQLTSAVFGNGGAATLPASISVGTLGVGDRVVVSVFANGDDSFDATNLSYQINVVP